ncbi:MAG: hypothetical protein IPK66_14295 [Rhodospirillales bacterium]|nr:hypothetical protein [Rhodospirillales bacterium]
MRRDNIDLPTLREDFLRLIIFDSVPTFSPFILELAFERAGTPIRKSYLDIPPDLRVKLREHIKARIRPLTVAAFGRSTSDAEFMIEDMTDKLFSLRNTKEIMPLIDVLRIPPDESIRLMSAWIGITYFEYEYAILQKDMKRFATWLIEFCMPREALRPVERERISSFVSELRMKMRGDWAEMVDIWKRYIESYQAYVHHDDVETFSAFLRGCNSHYWRLAEILGKLEQTLLTWKLFTRNYFNMPLPHFRLMEFYAVLKRLHLSDEDMPAISQNSFDSSLFSPSQARA